MRIVSSDTALGNKGFVIAALDACGRCLPCLRAILRSCQRREIEIGP